MDFIIEKMYVLHLKDKCSLSGHLPVDFVTTKINDFHIKTLRTTKHGAGTGVLTCETLAAQSGQFGC